MKCNRENKHLPNEEHRHLQLCATREEPNSSGSELGAFNSAETEMCSTVPEIDILKFLVLFVNYWQFCGGLGS